MNSSAALSIDTIPQRHESDSFAITLAPLSVEEIYALADDPANGAVVMMSGTVRNQTDGRRQHKAELRSYRLFDPSSRVGR